MLTRVTGNTGGIFKDVTAMVNAGSKNGRRLELYDGTRYQVSQANDGDGVLLSTGNFANPLTTESVQSIQLTGGGELVAGGVINQLQDSNLGYLLPLANSVPVGTILVVEVQEYKSDQTPIVSTQGGDLINILGGTDSSISWVGAAKLTLTSDGVSNWRL